MATRRIKEITNTATTFASDDFIALDGTTQGTRKMDKDDLIAEVSAGVSGDYLEEANNLSDVASLDTSKLNLEVPDVGTAPNEVPLNGMLGSMAYQSADSVAMARAEIESTTGTATTQALTVTDGTDDKFVVQESGKLTATSAVDAQTADFVSSNGRASVVVQSAGASNSSYVSLKSGANEIAFLDGRYDSSFLRVATNKSDAYIAFETGSQNEAVRIDSSQRVGINQTSPGSYHSYAYDLVVGDATGNRGITISSSSSGAGNIHFADGTTGTDRYRGYIGYDQTSDTMSFGTAATTKWQVNSSGNLVAYLAGAGIDFGSAATSAGDGTNTTGSASNSVLSDYEFGSWVPRFEMTGANFAALTMDVRAAQYVKIGRHVHCQAYIRTDNVDTTGASGTVAVNGLPFVADATANNHATLSVGWSSIWVNAPTAGFVEPNAAYVHLTRNGTTGTTTIGASDITNGASSNVNQLIFTVSYIAST